MISLYYFVIIYLSPPLSNKELPEDFLFSSPVLSGSQETLRKHSLTDWLKELQIGKVTARDWIVSPKSYVEALTSNVTVFGDKACNLSEMRA